MLLLTIMSIINETIIEIAENLVRFVNKTPPLNGFIVSSPVETTDDTVRLQPVKSNERTDQPVVTGIFKQTLFKSAKTDKEKLYRDILFQTAEDLRLVFRDSGDNVVFEGLKITSVIAEKYVAVKKDSISAQIVAVRNGLLSIGHRPKQSDLFDLRDEGFTHVITVLGESEKAGEIGRETEKIGLQWIWLPLGSAKVPVEDAEDIQHIETVLRQLVTLFRNSEARVKVYFHCSAGMHRTGIITFALLRRLGYNLEEAMNLLTQLRELTAKNVGAERIAWANSICE